MLRFLVFTLLISLALGCTKDEAPSASDVATAYADLVHANYSEALAATVAMEQAITRLTAEPSAGRLEYAKRAWLDARAIYGQTEAFRFYGGPIDDETGPEGRINGWPLDEAYIDYVEGQPNAGIINNPAIDITKDKLATFNEGAAGDIL
jgi:putative iron-regulated protein